MIRCMRGCFAVLGLLSLTSACSTHYVPRAGPRLSIVMEGGAPAYAKDGKVYKHGFAGGGLVDAVEDDPEALEAAQKYQSSMVTGFLLIVAGSACLTASVILLAMRDPLDERDSTNDNLALGTAICGLAGYVSGSVVLATGQPYHFDAVNIYNDKVDRRRFLSPPGYGPAPWTQPIPYGAPQLGPPGSKPSPPPAAPPPPAAALPPAAAPPPPPVTAPPPLAPGTVPPQIPPED
jgi:hypothetical protein